jgi:hypothetical protein
VDEKRLLWSRLCWRAAALDLDMWTKCQAAARLDGQEAIEERKEELLRGISGVLIPSAP